MHKPQLETSLETLRSSISQIQLEALQELAHRGLKFPPEFQPKNRKNKIVPSQAFKALLKENNLSEEEGIRLLNDLYSNNSDAKLATASISKSIELILNNAINTNIQSGRLEENWKGLVLLSDNGVIPDNLFPKTKKKSKYHEALSHLAARLQKSNKDIDDLLLKNIVNKYLADLLKWRAAGMNDAPIESIIDTEITQTAYDKALTDYKTYRLPIVQKSFTDWLNGKPNPYMGYSLVSLMEDPIEHYEMLKIRYDKGVELRIDPDLLNQKFAIIASQYVIDKSICKRWKNIRRGGGVNYHSDVIKRLLDAGVKRGISSGCRHLIQLSINRLEKIENQNNTEDTNQLK